MKNMLLISLAALTLSAPALAADNAVVVISGTGVTMKSKDVGSGVQAMQPIMSDATGVPVGTTGNPFQVGAPAVSHVDGWDVTQGAKSDAACSTANGSCSLIALIKFLNVSVNSPPPLGLNGVNTAWTGLTPGVAQTGTIVAANIDTTSIGGTAVSRGVGAVGNGAQRVAVGQDVTTLAGSAPGTAGTPSTNVLSVQGITGGTPQPVTPGTLAGGVALVQGTTAAMTGTTSTQIVALIASQRLYITRVACKGDPANTVGTRVQIRDGSAGALLDTLTVGASGGGEQGVGSTPLFWTTAGTALYAQNVTTGASVICTASGYSG